MISDTKVSSIKDTLDSNVRVSSIKDTLKNILLHVVVPLLVVRVLLTLVGIIAAYLLLPLVNRQQPIVPDWSASHLPDMLVSMWSHFDSGFYLGIAQGGYWSASTLHSQSNWGFFPFYPLVIHV